MVEKTAKFNGIKQSLKKNLEFERINFFIRVSVYAPITEAQVRASVDDRRYAPGIFAAQQRSENHLRLIRRIRKNPIKFLTDLPRVPDYSKGLSKKRLSQSRKDNIYTFIFFSKFFTTLRENSKF